MEENKVEEEIKTEEPKPEIQNEEELKSEKQKKNNKLLLVIVAIIFLLIGFGIGFLVTNSLNNKEESNEPKQVNNNNQEQEGNNTQEVNQKEKNCILKEYDSGDYPYLKVVTCDEKVYVIESYEKMNNAIDMVIANTINLDNDGIYKESDITLQIIDLNPNNIADVFIAHDPIANDAVAMAFIILKDGKVKKVSADWNNQKNFMTLSDATEFENYSVKKIKSYDCSDTFDNGLYPECIAVKSEFELIDGTNKAIEFELKK